MTFRTRLFWAGSAFSAIVSAHTLALAADYYFDPNGGDDTLSGTTEATAKKTLKLPTGTGNTVYIKRGSTLGSSLNASNITIKAYGCGLRPVVNGTVNVNNATVEGINAKPTNGVGFQVNSNSTLRDCETDGINDFPTNSAGCMGITINGTNNHITGCYVHDFGFSQSGVGMNSSGGAEGIMVMGSDNEVSFCSVVNSYSPNTTLGGWEGGCYEIVNGKAGSTMSNISFHHNYCERSVGLFETSSGDFSGTGGGIQTNHGIVENVTVSYNISVDSMWLFLLQPVNTDFKNFVFSNNTIIHTTKSGGLDTASGVVNVRDLDPGPPTTFGAGFYLEGNLIADAEQLVRNYDPAQTRRAMLLQLAKLTRPPPGAHPWAPCRLRNRKHRSPAGPVGPLTNARVSKFG